MEFLLIGAGLCLPLLQELFNKYIPSKFRPLAIWGLSLIAASIYIVLKNPAEFSLQYFIGSFAVTATVANGIYNYLIKPSREK